jgi:hypothetical protein
MGRIRTLLLGTAGVLGTIAVAGVVARNRTTPRVPYETIDRLDGVEIRRYPTTVVVETAAASEREAFGRLFRYISGANRVEESVEMTAPVATSVDEGPPRVERQAAVSMTAPVETETDAGGVRMAFFLPPEYDYDTAPRPTDPEVRLVEVPERMLAVRSFSWWATEGRVERQTDQLVSALDSAPDLRVAGDPHLLRYDSPGTPPFLRTNEVAVEVRRIT